MVHRRVLIIFESLLCGQKILEPDLMRIRIISDGAGRGAPAPSGRELVG